MKESKEFLSNAKFVFAHWKVGVHLLFRTRHFGVNNEWWSKGRSVMGLPLYRQIINAALIFPLLKNYRMMKIRFGASVGFLEHDRYKKIFGED